MTELPYLAYDDWDQRWSRFVSKKASDKEHNELNYRALVAIDKDIERRKLNKCWLEDQWRLCKGEVVVKQV
jgi:hypothetical protein